MPGTSSANPFAPGASIIVNTTEDEYGDGPSCSLREAIQAANTDTAFGGCLSGSGTDVITIQRSGADVVYTVYLSRGGSYEDDNATGDLNITSDMTIQGDGMHTTVIDAQYMSPRSRIFAIDNVDAMISVSIKRLSLIYGDSRAENGGAIYNRETLLLEDVAIEANHSGGNGGAIATSPFANDDQSTTLRRCYLVGNTSTYSGGAVNNFGNLTIEKSYFYNNATDDITNGRGGGLFSNGNIHNDYLITGSIFKDNDAASDGGNLYLESESGTILIEDSVITGGATEYGDGGNVYAYSDPANELNVIFRNTEISYGQAGLGMGANQKGGGIYSEVLLLLENVTISGNYAQLGGGIYSAQASATSEFLNITVAYNTHEDTLGAGVYKAAAGPITITNSIVALNGLPDTCSGHYCDCYTAVNISSGYNIERGDSCGFTAEGDQSIYPLIGPLSLNWGFSQTHPLVPGSPAIDHGNNATCLATTSAAGTARSKA